MSLSRIVAAAVRVAGLLGSLRAEEKKADNKKLILGVWELTKAGDENGRVLEFSGGNDPRCPCSGQ
jgi:hypothetical protein